MKKEYDFKNTKRGRFAKKFPTLEGRGVQEMHPRVINVSFDVTQEVAAALRALRDTGFYGNGTDCASVAEELLRRALLDPEVASHRMIRTTNLRFDPLTREQSALLNNSTANQRRKKRRTQ